MIGGNGRAQKDRRPESLASPGLGFNDRLAVGIAAPIAGAPAEAMAKKSPIMAKCADGSLLCNLFDYLKNSLSFQHKAWYAPLKKCFYIKKHPLTPDSRLCITTPTRRKRTVIENISITPRGLTYRTKFFFNVVRQGKTTAWSASIRHLLFLQHAAGGGAPISTVCPRPPYLLNADFNCIPQGP